MPASEVARYYDRNTRRFLLFGRGRGVHAMHRELWGPDVRSARGAVEYVNRVLARELSEIASLQAPVIVDFGCGVGGTLFHLARKLPGARFVGVTVSPRQVGIARRLARRSGFGDRCTFVLGDFQDAELDVLADGVVAVESFAHSDSRDAFFASVARHLRPGGRLIVVDDFLARDERAMHEEERRRVEQFRSGWRVAAACTADQLAETAERHGLAPERAADLTPLTRPGSRLRDRAVAALGPALDRIGLAREPFCGNLIGGHALQVGLRDGFIRYGLHAFRRIA